MSKIFLLVMVIVLGANELHSQSFTTTGDWNTASNWTPAVVPSGESTDVTISASVNPTISILGSPHVIGNIDASAGTNDIIIDASTSLSLGSSALFIGGTLKSLTLGNFNNLWCTGSIEIWGNLIVNQSVDIIITGTFVVHGDVTIIDNGDLSVSGTGTLDVKGNFNGGLNTDISTAGSATINIDGDLILDGPGSSISGPDNSITIGGTCTLNGGLCPVGPLPIELLFFAGKETNSNVVLDWATASEQNFDYFEIERASDGTSFDYIGRVAGNGNSYSRLDYAFEDENSEIGLNYYRLKSIDYDGSFEYSEVILVKFTSNVKLVVSPNPTFGVVSVQTSMPTTDGLKYKITNQYGVVVAEGSLLAYNTRIDLQGLPKGIYIIRLVGLSTVKAKRIILK